MKFATCDEDIPLLGYENEVKLSTMFHEVPESQSFLPTANTCVGNLQLPRPTHEIPLPAEEQLFEKFDMAFFNSYFGHR